jgi:phosphate transport system protein
MQERDTQLLVLKEKLLEIGRKAEAAIANATQALVERRPSLAQEVVEAGTEIERLEVEIDNICIAMLAGERPAGSDLQFITAALKIVRDIARIGDSGVNIARRGLEVVRGPELKPIINVAIAARAAQFTLKQSLDAFVNGNLEIAKCVIEGDGYIDDLCQQILRELVTDMLEDPNTVPRARRLIFVARNLERAGDHATSIARAATITSGGQCENTARDFRIGAAC